MICEKFEVHSELNPKLWENKILKPEIRAKLLEIANEFLESCEVPIHVVDIHIVGSQASYNYTKYSDLDLHIIANFELIPMDAAVVQKIYNCLKASFNSSYDIKIKGIDVELYVEDVNTNVVSNGIYSILNNSWIKTPQMITDVPEIDISAPVYEWKKRIDTACLNASLEEVESLIDELYMMRKNSLSLYGEYGEGNQVMKELRNDGYVQKLKDAYKEKRSKDLSLESFNIKMLREDSRNTLLNKSKQTAKGFQRFKKRVKSRVANSVKQYNSIDMNKLFKEDILTVDVNVKGETDNYTVKIRFGGFLELLKEQLHRQNDVLDYKAVTRALINGFNRDDVYISCSCPDWKYRFAYFATRNDINSGESENRPSDITNPDDKLGSACKHVLLVLSNTSFLLKVSSTILNYIRYMEKHYEKLYADIIYPAIYDKEYSEPVQLDIFDDDTMETDSDTIDKSNEYARTKNQFKQGNTQGVRFAPSSNRQVTIDDTVDTGSATGDDIV